MAISSTSITSVKCTPSGSPVKDIDRVRGRVSQVQCDLVKIMDRYLPWLLSPF